MTIANYEYQSEFARRYFAQGVAEGKAEGKADMLARQLARRFGSLPDGLRTRLAATPATELDAIGERLLGAQRLDQALRQD